MPISQIIMARGSAGGGGGGGGGGGSYNGSGPTPGQGSYLGAWSGSAGWSAQGTPFDPGNGLASIDNPQPGWMRRIYPGLWSNLGTAGDDVPGLFDGAPTFQEIDVFGSFGQTAIGDNYAMEWKGYIQVFNTGTYNFLIDSDDVAMFWIGSAALNPTFNNKLCYSNNSNQLNPNSVILTTSLYYPIRMRFQEWAGAERCQIFTGLVGSGADLAAMSNWTLRYNGNTQGY
jgi:hypothetical protein